MTIETAHSIGDLVYLADADSIDRKVIDAIRVNGVDEKVYYGFKQTNYSYLFYTGEHAWHETSEVFSRKEEAVKKHTRLKEEKELAEKKTNLKKLKQAKDDYEKMKKAFLEGKPIEFDDEDEDY